MAAMRRSGRGSRERDKAVWECVTGERSTRTAPVVDYDIEGPERQEQSRERGEGSDVEDSSVSIEEGGSG